LEGGEQLSNQSRYEILSKKNRWMSVPEPIQR
jgi:hypothetical protein